MPPRRGFRRVLARRAAGRRAARPFRAHPEGFPSGGFIGARLRNADNREGTKNGLLARSGGSPNLATFRGPRTGSSHGASSIRRQPRAAPAADAARGRPPASNGGGVSRGAADPRRPRRGAPFAPERRLSAGPAGKRSGPGRPSAGRIQASPVPLQSSGQGLRRRSLPPGKATNRVPAAERVLRRSRTEIAEVIFVPGPGRCLNPKPEGPGSPLPGATGRAVRPPPGPWPDPRRSGPRPVPPRPAGPPPSASARDPRP